MWLIQLVVSVAKRNDIEATVHDKIISTLAKSLNKKHPNLIIRTNPSNLNQYGVTRKGINTFYPDIYVTDKKSVKEIYEVETENTITEEECLNQWKVYGAGNSKFILVVPREKLSKAKELCKKHDVDVNDFFVF